MKRSRPLEFQELEIRNISFMASLDNGSGQNKQLIIGAIILAFPYIISNNPFQNSFMENAWLSGDQALLPTIASLATQLSESLSAATASGELGDQWRMVERLNFSDAIQVLKQSSRPSSENAS